MGKGNPIKNKMQFLNDPNLPGLLITVNLLFNFGSLVLFNFDSHTHIWLIPDLLNQEIA